jgi:HSP20 family protein
MEGGVSMAGEKYKGELEPAESRGMMPAFGDEMERLMERFFGRSLMPSWMPSFRWPDEVKMPYAAVDVYEDASSVVLKAELPGMTRDEIDVEITGDMITISGEKKKEEKIERGDYHRMERSFGSFRRSFSLPAEVQSAKAKAKFKDGMLEIKVPKTKEAKEKKVKIQIED